MRLAAADLKGFSSDADSYEDEAKEYTAALGRNKTMIPHIIEAARNYSQELPIAFIGSYHTKGIVTALRNAGVSYVVIEPRPRVATSEAENQTFDMAIHSDTRPGFPTRARLNMGQTVPAPQEVTSVYRPKIGTKLLQIESARAATRESFVGIGDKKVDVPKLWAAADDNASLSGARISSGGKSPPPPTSFSAAFAFFDPEKPGGPGSPSLVIVDPADQRWTDGGRYEFLRQAVFRAPKDSGPVAAGLILNLYPDDTGSRHFLTYYEPKSKRIYCFESDPQHVASLVTLPLGPGQKEQDVRSQVVKVIRLKGRTKNG